MSNSLLVSFTSRFCILLLIFVPVHITISLVFTLFNVLVCYLAVSCPFLREIKHTATARLEGEMDVFI